MSLMLDKGLFSLFQQIRQPGIASVENANRLSPARHVDVEKRFRRARRVAHYQTGNRGASSGGMRFEKPAGDRSTLAGVCVESARRRLHQLWRIEY